jgi:hypothetical protein
MKQTSIFKVGPEALIFKREAVDGYDPSMLLPSYTAEAWITFSLSYSRHLISSSPSSAHMVSGPAQYQKSSIFL